MIKTQKRTVILNLALGLLAYILLCLFFSSSFWFYSHLLLLASSSCFKFLLFLLLLYINQKIVYLKQYTNICNDSSEEKKRKKKKKEETGSFWTHHEDEYMNKNYHHLVHANIHFLIFSSSPLKFEFRHGCDECLFAYHQRNEGKYWSYTLFFFIQTYSRTIHLNCNCKYILVRTYLLITLFSKLLFIERYACLGRLYTESN